MSALAQIFGLGPAEIALIVVILIIFFGPRQLPELGKAFGRFFRELKKASSASEPEEENPPASEPEKK